MVEKQPKTCLHQSICASTYVDSRRSGIPYALCHREVSGEVASALLLHRQANRHLTFFGQRRCRVDKVLYWTMNRDSTMRANYMEDGREVVLSLDMARFQNYLKLESNVEYIQYIR